MPLEVVPSFIGLQAGYFDLVFSAYVAAQQNYMPASASCSYVTCSSACTLQSTPASFLVRYTQFSLARDSTFRYERKQLLRFRGTSFLPV